MKLPRHVSFTIEHNEFVRNYETAEDVIKFGDDYYSDGWISEEQKQKAVETNSIWTAHWYPETPVGFCLIHAADLDVLLAALEAEE